MNKSGALLFSKFLTLVWFLCLFLPVIDLPPEAKAQANPVSPLMTNLSGVSYYSSEQPFLDIFKTGAGWITRNDAKWSTDETQYLQLDAHGWPISLAGAGGKSVSFTWVATLLQRLQSPFYPAGRYIVLYDGKGTITYGFDASKNNLLSVPGRDVIEVTPSSGGILLEIKSTDPEHTGNYIRNIRIVQAAYEVNLREGQIFHPAFLSRLAPFRGYRFMDWMATNNSQQTVWAKRPHDTDAFWGAGAGVPAEAMVALLNEQGADGWFNMPHMASDDYITRFATLVHAALNTQSKVYVEYSNEVWNLSFQQANYANAQGRILWPQSGNQWYAGSDYYGMRFAQMCNIWKIVWGEDAGRVVCVLATQAASVPPSPSLLSSGRGGIGYEDLNCPLAAPALGKPCYKFADAVAIAPYFGYDVPHAWTEQADGGLTSLFAEMTQGGLAKGGYPGGMIKQALDWTEGWKAVADRYGFDLITYEGGQSLQNTDDTALQNLYETANRDARMGAAYTQYLTGWKAAGGNLFAHFNDAGAYSKWGYWGALENIMVPTSPKYSALTSFIAHHPCWWTGCAGSIQSQH